MSMHNPPHPGEFIQATYLQPFKLSCQLLAQKLDVASVTVEQIINKQATVTPEMALRLSKSLGRTPESWLAMQDAYDLWQVKKTIELDKVEKVHFEEAA